MIVGLVIVDQGVREIAERCRREAALQQKADALVVTVDGADSRLAGQG